MGVPAAHVGPHKSIAPWQDKAPLADLAFRFQAGKK